MRDTSTTPHAMKKTCGGAIFFPRCRTELAARLCARGSVTNDFQFKDVVGSSWLLALAAAVLFGSACGSSDGSRAERSSEGGEDAGGEAGQGAQAHGAQPSGGGGTAGSQPDGGDAAGDSNDRAAAAGQGGALTGGGAPSEAGSGARDDAGAGAGGAADDLCGGCCTVRDCPADGAGYLCTDHQCVDVAASLSGLSWKLPCTGAIDAVSCASDPTVTVSTTLAGVSGVTYDVELHFRGVIEPKIYTG